MSLCRGLLELTNPELRKEADFGLSISKSLTELQKGKFEIAIDGDLFKVLLEFDRV